MFPDGPIYVLQRDMVFPVQLTLREQVVSSVTITTAGSGYALTDTGAESAEVVAGGTGYAIGDTITLAGGTFSNPVILTVSTTVAGAVAEATVVQPGAYSVTPSPPVAQGSTSGVGTGATFSILFGSVPQTITLTGGTFSTPTLLTVAALTGSGVSSVSLTQPGAYSSLPANPVAQGTTSGGGSGATFGLVFDPTYRYSWSEQGFNQSGALVDAAYPRRGTGVVNPAVELNNQVVNLPTYSWLRLRAGVSGYDLYDFLAPEGSGGSATFSTLTVTDLTILSTLSISNLTVTVSGATVFSGTGSVTFNVDIELCGCMFWCKGNDTFPLGSVGLIWSGPIGAEASGGIGLLVSGSGYGDLTNWVPPAKSAVRLSAGAAGLSIRSLDPTCNGVSSGRMLLVENVGSNLYTIINGDALGTPTMTVRTASGADLDVPPRFATWLQYDGASQYWRELQFFNLEVSDNTTTFYGTNKLVAAGGLTISQPSAGVVQLTGLNTASDGYLGQFQFADGDGGFVNAPDISNSSLLDLVMQTNTNYIVWNGAFDLAYTDLFSPRTRILTSVATGSDTVGLPILLYVNTVALNGDPNGGFRSGWYYRYTGDSTTTLNHLILFEDMFGIGGNAFVYTAPPANGVSTEGGRLGWSLNYTGGLYTPANISGNLWINSFGPGLVIYNDLLLDVYGNCTFGFGSDVQAQTLSIRKRTSVQPGLTANKATVGGVLFDHFADAGNVSTGETDLYSDTITANTLPTNGDKVRAAYGGTFAATVNTKRLRAYFAGILIFDTGVLTISAGDSWELRILLIRKTSATARAIVALITNDASIFSDAAYTPDSTLTGLDFTANNVLKLTGQSSAASNDVVAAIGTVEWLPAKV